MISYRNKFLTLIIGFMAFQTTAHAMLRRSLQRPLSACNAMNHLVLAQIPTGMNRFMSRKTTESQEDPQPKTPLQRWKGIAIRTAAIMGVYHVLFVAPKPILHPELHIKKTIVDGKTVWETSTSKNIFERAISLLPHEYFDGCLISPYTLTDDDIKFIAEHFPNIIELNAPVDTIESLNPLSKLLYLRKICIKTTCISNEKLDALFNIFGMMSRIKIENDGETNHLITIRRW